MNIWLYFNPLVSSLNELEFCIFFFVILTNFYVAKYDKFVLLLISCERMKIYYYFFYQLSWKFLYSQFLTTQSVFNLKKTFLDISQIKSEDD